jgi:uncharacterized 2Fe-2S/4Fe-4S cluster protein (DUF4445 family)
MSLEKRNRVRFLPEGVWVEVSPDETLMEAARRIGIEIASACGGQGTCGRCKVRILSGKARSKKEVGSPALARMGYVLSCQTYPEEDLTVEIPMDSRVGRARATIRHEEIEAPGYEVGLERYPLNPLARKLALSIPKPSLLENVNDLTRLSNAIRKEIGWSGDIDISLSALRGLPELLRKGEWKVTVTLGKIGDRLEIIRVEPGWSNTPPLGLAIDVGTTTITVYLVDLRNGKTIQRLATYNEQFIYGEDVITRIIYASKGEGNLEGLRQAALRSVNQLIEEALKEEGYELWDISCAVLAGNTTMTHIFLGIDPKYIRLEPYIPAAVRFPPIRAKEIGLKMNPDGYVFAIPCVGSYVGGDVVAGTLISGISESKGIGMLVDIGTNGEIVVGNEEFMVSCACSMGPAFEGGGITCGMRSVSGAIHRVRIGEGGEEVWVGTIGGERAIGICGSGLIELLASLLDAGILDMSGNFRKDMRCSRLREVDGEDEFVLLWSYETGLGRDMTITQSDIKNLIRAKAAMYAGIRYLLKSVGIDLKDVERIYVAGAFGSHLDIRSAIRIGMFPDIGEERYVVTGNSSVKGARLALLSYDALKAMDMVASKITYIELSTETSYMEEFVSANFLPHTDLSLFPSVTYGQKGVIL